MSESSRRKVERAALRRHGRAARRSIEDSQRVHAERLLASHLGSVHFRNGTTVGSFISDDGEPRLDAVIRHHRRLGLRCALPVPDATRRADGSPVALKNQQMAFRVWHAGDDLVAGPLGIPVPPARPDAVDVVPDVLLVPLVAFDDQGNRLGRGAGFYDRYLDEHRTSGGSRPVAIGVAFEGQRVDAIAAEPYDEVLDVVVTELGIRWIGPKGTS